MTGAISGLDTTNLVLPQYRNNALANSYYYTPQQISADTVPVQNTTPPATKEEISFQGKSDADESGKSKKSGRGLLVGTIVVGAASAIAAGVIGKGKFGAGYRTMWDWGVTQFNKLKELKIFNRNKSG